MASTKEQENGENSNDLNFAFGVSEKERVVQTGSACVARDRPVSLATRWQVDGDSFERPVRKIMWSED
jgi:hypothetical protein